MRRHTIVLKRAGMRGLFITQSMGTDALNALQSIPGVSNPEICSESDNEVTLVYEWMGKETFWQTEEYLLKYGLARADWNEGK